MNWFGDPWDVPVNAPAAKVETPAGSSAAIPGNGSRSGKPLTCTSTAARCRW